ncbi:hypothetical protein KFL_002240070 [Klebsormidium nitens]|uniref:Alpha-ketoglutarate-dependent dioxygenase AlkB-like domain-containing protein n=1 Tax=Klebsormidium nitens TaxID=105231 RepID=A0A1Y1I2R0_KLENI|nr:hypothetical protein KFL_002240070 [Klebsormidium nitens]|eukprot:GAQ85204.1 hypothetical protein KFL_002240070 [Klebsormidium nitens]
MSPELNLHHQQKHKWQQVAGVPGLWLCPNFLRGDRQEKLLKDILAEGWFETPVHNQAMRFGDLPAWAEALSKDIHQSVIHFAGSLDIDTPDSETPLTPPLLWREPLFDQMIVNSYQPGEGISSHVDLARFEDGIAIVSLGREEVMEFHPVRAEQDSAKSGLKQASEAESSATRQSKRVKYCRESETESRADEARRDSAELFHTGCNQRRGSEPFVGRSVSPSTGQNGTTDVDGEARYNWKHGIPGRTEIDKTLQTSDKVRISVTLRRLCQTS